MHIHAADTAGEAKFWLEPNIELVKSYNLSGPQLREIEDIIKEHRHEFENAWHKLSGA